jgi:Xaa-Pro aminopeptidase
VNSGARGDAPPVDFARLRVARRRRLREAMGANGFDALVLVGPSNQEYAGVRQPPADAMRMHHEPVVVIVTADGDAPYVWTPFPEGVPDDVPADHVHGPLLLEFPEGVERLARAVRDVAPGARRVGFDEMTSPMIGVLPKLLEGLELGDATLATGAARLLKTADEIECIRHAQHINELAMHDVEAALRPGIRQNELSAIFLRNVFELGASSSIIDPIWSLTPRSIAAGTHTANADVGFPLASNDRFVREGDLVLCDTGITWEGYHSDFGKTWICSVDPKPTADLQACYARWCEVIDAVYATIKPGATCGDLVRAAAAVEPKHALKHFYLGHGCGCDSGEAPFIGSDLGVAFDDTVELAPGMVFVLEPVVWRDGIGGYRSEEIVALTEDGFEKLTTYGYSPFE